MPVTMGGMASGIDTDSIIQKLVDVEARPIKQWTADKNRSKRRKEALSVLKSSLTDLNNSVKTLYGFRASYDDKKVISSNTGILQASANKDAEKGVRKVEVKELASIHKIATDPIKKKKKLPSGKFRIEVNGESESVRFRGGNLESLKKKIDEVASELVSTSYIKTSAENYVLTVESKIPGKKGEILITGNKDFLKGIGLIKGEKGEKKEKLSLVFDRKYFTSYIGEQKPEKQDGSLDIGKKGKSVSITGVLWREYILPLKQKVKKDTILEFNIVYKKKKIEEDEEVLPFRIEIGPEERTYIKGIELKSYNVSRIRPIEKKKKKKDIIDVVGIGVTSNENGKRIEKIYKLEKDAKGKQVIPIGKDFAGKSVSKMIFYCNKGKAIFSGANILTPIKGIGILEPKNEIRKAANARLDIDGIEIIREKNNDLNDVIKGVSLNLRGTSKSPVVLTIESDIEKAVENIKKFVNKYNEYLDLNKQLTKTEKTSKVGDYKKIKHKTGLFVGDMTILRLENSLKRVVSEAYPTRAKNPIKILPQTGISTGALNAEWESIRDGKLVLDQDKLYNTITENPEGIKEFFGSDTDGDNRIDNGMAYRIGYILKPYLMSGNNVIAGKLNLENDTIKTSDDKISRHQAHLKKYEDKLRKKFATMERAISGANAQRAWMKGQGMGGSDTKKGK